MDVILLQDVEKLGLRGDVVGVARGYARNFLLPRKLAEPATPARVAELRRVEAERAKHEARSSDQANEVAEVLTKTVLRFEVKAGPTGALFGSVTPSDVADAIWRARKSRGDRRRAGRGRGGSGACGASPRAGSRRAGSRRVRPRPEPSRKLSPPAS